MLHADASDEDVVFSEVVVSGPLVDIGVVGVSLVSTGLVGTSGVSLVPIGLVGGLGNPLSPALPEPGLMPFGALKPPGMTRAETELKVSKAF